jgi:hypothetical protein
MKDYIYNINFPWGIQNVLDVREDLTYDEAYQVLLKMQERYDREEGVNNTLVLDISYELYPEDRERTLRKYKVRLGRKDINQCYLEVEGYSEYEVEQAVEKMIDAGEFHNKTFTTTAITREYIMDIE